MKIKHLFFALICLIQTISFGQEMETSVSKKNIAVGEPFTIKFEIEINENDAFSVNPKFDSIVALKLDEETKEQDTAYFDILNNIQPKKEKIQGKYYWIFGYQVIAFDPGTFFLPPQDFKLNSKKIKSNPKMISIALMDKNKDVDLYDIEENFTELPSFFNLHATEIILWSLLLIALIAFGLMYYFFYYRKHKKSQTEEFTAVTNHKELAIKSLNQLMNEKLWEKDQLKEHFTQVSLITRRYLSKQMNESFMERTSLETQLILRNKGIRANQLEPLGLILNVTDMVKYAKSSLEADGVMAVYQETKKFIEDFEIR